MHGPSSAPLNLEMQNNNRCAKQSQHIAKLRNRGWKIKVYMIRSHLKYVKSNNLKEGITTVHTIHVITMRTREVKHS